MMGRPVLGSPVSVSDIHGGSVLDWTRQTSARVHVFHDRVELGLERAAVPVVLDSVVTPPRQHLGYVHPLVAVQTASSEHSVSDCPQAGRGRARQISAPVSMNESFLLFNVPRTLPHSRVEMIEPAASARAAVSKASSRRTTDEKETYRSRHCLPTRPGRCSAMRGQFFAPCIWTSSRTFMSSSSFHGFLDTRPASL